MLQLVITVATFRICKVMVFSSSAKGTDCSKCMRMAWAVSAKSMRTYYRFQVDLNLRFVCILADNDQCDSHLINSGLIHAPGATSATLEFEGTGPSPANPITMFLCTVVSDDGATRTDLTTEEACKSRCMLFSIDEQVALEDHQKNLDSGPVDWTQDETACNKRVRWP